MTHPVEGLLQKDWPPACVVPGCGGMVRDLWQRATQRGGGFWIATCPAHSCSDFTLGWTHVGSREEPEEDGMDTEARWRDG